MIQRRNIVACLVLLGVCAFASVAEAGLFCPHLCAGGLRRRVLVTYACTCTTKDGRQCTGRGPTMNEAKRKARELCQCQETDVAMWNCVVELRRIGIFGRCRITTCPVSECDSCAAVSAKAAAGAKYKATCTTVSGNTCIGYGTTCVAAMQNAQDNCSEDIEMCRCTIEMKRKAAPKSAK